MQLPGRWCTEARALYPQDARGLALAALGASLSWVRQEPAVSCGGWKLSRQSLETASQSSRPYVRLNLIGKVVLVSSFLEHPKGKNGAQPLKI